MCSKVHGIEGLRIDVPSFTPECVRADTNFTTIMIGERVGNFMRNGH